MKENEDTMTSAEVYRLLADLVIHAEKTRWARLNTVLVLNSILLATWTLLFSGTKEFIGKEFLLVLLCLPGIWLGILFSCLGWRSSQYLDDYHGLAERIEKQFPEGLPRPFHRSARRRKTLRRGLGRLTSSKWLVTYTPAIYAVVFAILAVASKLLSP